MRNLIKLAPSAGFEIFKTLSPRPEYLRSSARPASAAVATILAGELHALSSVRAQQSMRGR